MATEGRDLQVGEQEALAFHLSEGQEAYALWQQGLNLLMDEFRKLNAHPTPAPDVQAMTALLVQAWNNLHAALDLALRGYYGPANNLLRLPMEVWMGCRYLRWFPGEHDRFLPFFVGGPEMPDFSEMQSKVEVKEGGPPDATTRGWMEQLHKYSHIDRRSLGLLAVPKPDGSFTWGLGPQQRVAAFWQCAYGGTAALSMLLNEANKIRALLRVDVNDALPGYVGRVLQWQASLSREALARGLGKHYVKADQ